MQAAKATLILVVTLGLGCSTKPVKPTPSPEERLATARKSVEALQAARFEEAGQEARLALQQDAGNPQARVVAAITHYKKTMHNFVQDLMTNVAGMIQARTINHRYLQWSFDQAEKELAKVEEHLAAAAEDPDFHLELCLACWEYDWNHNGQVDERDRVFLQIEQDEAGNPIPEGDPRRTPTFRFDRGDVYWARAMVAFQRAAFNLFLAYQLPEASQFMGMERTSVLVIKMIDKNRVHSARDRFLEGLAHADRARSEYLAERDDEGEWLPNPAQKNHPLPLPVDEALYETWRGVLDDLRKLIEGKEGISVAEAAQLGDHQWENPPTGFIHVGRLLESPGDITLDIANLDNLEDRHGKQDVERVLKDVFGDKYVSAMKPTRLLSRFHRMKQEIERGEESLERKLRYLLWVN